MLNHEIIVNSSESREIYYTAYKYFCKKDCIVIHSQNHPDWQEVGSPKTKKCIKANKESYRKRRSFLTSNLSTRKAKRLQNIGISKFLVANNIKTEDELMDKAQKQFAEGKKDLKKFILSKSPKALQDLLTTTWKTEKNATNIQRQQKCWMEIIREILQKEFVEECSGNWYHYALEVLQRNNIEWVAFAPAMRELLSKGRGKFRNILIVGPANCGKTFLLLPLQKIFITFSNPTNDKYAWLGTEKAEIIFLNDFRWSQEMIAWKELLILLEDQTVHLPSPKIKMICKMICKVGNVRKRMICKVGNVRKRMSI